MPVAMTDASGAKYYLHYDQVGSLRAVSDTNGNVVKEISYDAFGNILTDSNPNFKVPFGFAGGLYDPDTQLTHFGYREYDSFTGKWTAKDPIGFAGGDSNLYGYVLNDPVNFVDPTGLDPRLNGRGVPAAMGGDGKGTGPVHFPKGPFGSICGAEGDWKTTWIPDATPDACQKHDDCYSTCGKTKQECDLEFNKHNSVYAQVVWLMGQKAYDKAQAHCKCDANR